MGVFAPSTSPQNHEGCVPPSAARALLFLALLFEKGKETSNGRRWESAMMIPWRHEMGAALKEAKAGMRPVLLDFSAAPT